eukprot:TRINITY_DN72715_c0_g1_i1.p1 TRINITY_DN72715_c0_g1~~TRINITY_DN72715_c0_g1_i1.p1  ORF type:complete len:153 (+),score=16.14 TRINITY_DN72715_c0_g1_i1:99-557(+)
MADLSSITAAAAVLGVPAGASMHQIRTAFVRGALSSHPDKGGSHADFLSIRAAYEALSRRARSGEADGAAASVQTAAPATPVSRKRQAADANCHGSVGATAVGECGPKRQRRARLPRKPTNTSASQRQLSPRAMARKLGMFPQRVSLGFPVF